MAVPTVCSPRSPPELSQSSRGHESGDGSSSGSTSSEDEAELCEIGLHPTRRGTVLGGRYRVEARLGVGNFATVWLCSDSVGHCEVALKVYQADNRLKNYARDEIAILKRVVSKRGEEARGEGPAGSVYAPVRAAAAEVDVGRPSAATAAGLAVAIGHGQSSCVVALLGDCLHCEAHCSHPCLALEVLGPSLLELAERCHGDRLPLPVVRLAAHDALCGLDFLHRTCGIIHTDIKPENILAHLDGHRHCQRTSARQEEKAEEGPLQKKRRCKVGTSYASRLRSLPHEILVTALRGGRTGSHVGFKLADLGNSCFEEAHASEYIQTCEYKAPEVLLGAGYNTSVDLWSLACVLFESATGRYLLDPRRKQVQPDEEEPHQVLAEREEECVGQMGSAKSVPGHAEGSGKCWTKRPAAGGTQIAATTVPLRRGWPGVPLEEEHIVQVVELTGLLPDNLLRRGRHTCAYLMKTEGCGWFFRHLGTPQEALQQRGVGVRLQKELGSRAAQADVIGLEGVLLPMLQAEPYRRRTAHALLKECAWLQPAVLSQS